MYEAALKVLSKLENNGYKAYIVGGYPRDKYLKIESFDIDICTSARSNEVASLFLVDKKVNTFGVTIIKEEGYLFEITTFRKDLEYRNHRYPKKIEFVDTLEEDLQRRDFTINTLCIDSNGNYIDLLGAKKDLDNKIIKAVGDADKKIEEDVLRIVRAIRFSIKLDFQIDIPLLRSIQKYKHLMNSISKTRIKKELKGLDVAKIETLWNNYLK